MDVNSVSNLIGSVGFPIACCIALFWYITKITAAHKEETNNLVNAINDMRVTMTQLVDKLNGKG